MKFVSMNNITVAPDQHNEFEKRFLEREKIFMTGCTKVLVLRPVDGDEYVIYSEWVSNDAYHNWVSSESFKKQHGKPTDHSIYTKPANIRSFFVIDENNEGF